MTPRSAVVGSVIFFVLAPVVVSGVGPWIISGWRTSPGLPGWWPVIAAPGWLLIAAGMASLVSAFARFVIEGRGTPAPVAPTSALVTGGQFAWVRNPMYLANISVVLGQAAVLGRWELLAYAAVVGLTMFAFVKLYEEPTLAAKFGTEYADYRNRVPGWWPRRPVVGG